MMMCFIILMVRRWYVILCIMCYIGCKYIGILIGVKKKRKRFFFFNIKDYVKYNLKI